MFIVAENTRSVNITRIKQIKGIKYEIRSVCRENAYKYTLNALLFVQTLANTLGFNVFYNFDARKSSVYV